QLLHYFSRRRRLLRRRSRSSLSSRRRGRRRAHQRASASSGTPTSIAAAAPPRIATRTFRLVCSVPLPTAISTVLHMYRNRGFLCCPERIWFREWAAAYNRESTIFIPTAHAKVRAFEIPIVRLLQT